MSAFHRKLILGWAGIAVLVAFSWPDTSPAEKDNQAPVDQRVEFAEPALLTLGDLCARLSDQTGIPVTCDPRVAERRVFLANVAASPESLLQHVAAALGVEMRRLEGQWHLGLKGSKRERLNPDWAKESQRQFLPLLVPFLEQQAGTEQKLFGQPLSRWLNNETVAWADLTPEWQQKVEEVWPAKDRPEDASVMLLAGIEVRVIHQKRLETVQANMERMARGEPLLPMEQGPSSVGMTVY